MILYKLSLINENNFTVKLLDAYINPEAIEDPQKLDTICLVFNRFEFDLGELLIQPNLNIDEN